MSSAGGRCFSGDVTVPHRITMSNIADTIATVAVQHCDMDLLCDDEQGLAVDNEFFDGVCHMREVSEFVAEELSSGDILQSIEKLATQGYNICKIHHDG